MPDDLWDSPRAGARDEVVRVRPERALVSVEVRVREVARHGRRAEQLVGVRDERASPLAVPGLARLDAELPPERGLQAAVQAEPAVHLGGRVEAPLGGLVPEPRADAPRRRQVARVGVAVAHQLELVVAEQAHDLAAVAGGLVLEPAEQIEHLDRVPPAIDAVAELHEAAAPAAPTPARVEEPGVLQGLDESVEVAVHVAEDDGGERRARGLAAARALARAARRLGARAGALRGEVERFAHAALLVVTLPAAALEAVRAGRVRVCINKTPETWAF